MPALLSLDFPTFHSGSAASGFRIRRKPMPELTKSIKVEAAASVRSGDFHGARALDDLQNVLVDHGEPSPGGETPKGLTIVHKSRWRERMVASGTVDPAAGNPRSAFKRISDDLVGRALIREWRDMICIVGGDNA